MQINKLSLIVIILISLSSITGTAQAKDQSFNENKPNTNSPVVKKINSSASRQLIDKSYKRSNSQYNRQKIQDSNRLSKSASSKKTLQWGGTNLGF
ncbi:MAG: hypothetical protein MK033_11570 [Candidatus Caenarcaniphilales bacterium]|nr:hypothetical protein [Candidatus Caenarcaniphilales bacterium]